MEWIWSRLWNILLCCFATFLTKSIRISAWRVSFETYGGVLVTIWSIFDWTPWILLMLVFLVAPHYWILQIHIDLSKRLCKLIFCFRWIFKVFPKVLQRTESIRLIIKGLFDHMNVFSPVGFKFLDLLNS